MANHQPSDQPIHELKFDAVPGYRLAFTIAIALMGLYLAFILYSSPGKVAHSKYGEKGGSAYPEKDKATKSKETE